MADASDLGRLVVSELCPMWLHLCPALRKIVVRKSVVTLVSCLRKIVVTFVSCMQCGVPWCSVVAKECRAKVCNVVTVVSAAATKLI